MLDLNKQEMLVLFELCHRICETSKIAASHPAEVVVIDKIAAELERSLSEPFMECFPNLLDSARNAVVDDYRQKMGERSWVEKVHLAQS